MTIHSVTQTDAGIYDLVVDDQCAAVVSAPATLEVQSSLCPADIAPENEPDGLVNVDDMLAVINAWGPCLCSEDVNGNGIVDVDDLLAVINAWGPCE